MHLASTREDLGERNRRIVLGEILLNGPISRTAIAERVGLTQASVSRITRNLIETDLVEEAEHYHGSSGRGRRFIGLRIKPNSGFVAGIAINVFSQDIVLGDLANGEVTHKRLNIPDLSDATQVLTHCAQELDELITRSGIERQRFIGCSVALAGAIDTERAILSSSPVLGWENVNIKHCMQSRLNIPLVVESNANAKNLTAHCFGPAKGATNLILFNCFLAVSASLLIDGHLLRGREFGTGLIESMLVPDETTSKLNPVDEVAGGFGVIGVSPIQDEVSGRYLARKLLEVISVAEEGDQDAQGRLIASGRALAWVIAQTNALLHADQILVSGPLIESEFYREGIRARLNELTNEDLVKERLRFFHITSHAAAHSLAIYHFLIRGDCEHELMNLAEGFKIA
ncbi:MAG: ROK family protein [bacterium]